MYSPDGRQLIAGTDRGLSFIRIEAGKINVHFFSAKNGLPDNIVTTLAESREKNSIWVGMQSKGILLFDITGNRISDTSYKSKWRSGR